MSTRMLRVVAVGAGLLAVVGGGLADGQVPAGLGLVLALLASCLVCAAAVRPDSSTGLAAFAAYGAFWLVEVSDPTSPWTLFAALMVLALHASLSLLAMTPPGVSLPRAVYARWSRRAGIVAVMTAGVWALTVGLDSIDPAPGLVLTVAAFAVVVVTVLAVRRESGATSG